MNFKIEAEKMSGFESIKEKINKMLECESFQGSVAVICGAMAYPNRLVIELARQHEMQHEMILIRDMKIGDLSSFDVGFSATEAEEALINLGNLPLIACEIKPFPDSIFNDQTSTCWHPTYDNECVKLWVNPSIIHTQRAKINQGYTSIKYPRRHNMRRKKFKQFDFFQKSLK